MVTLIDTSVLIEIEHGQLEFSAIVQPADAGHTYAMAAVTASELLHGVYRARRADLRTRRKAFVEYVLERIPSVPFDLAAARVHAQLWAELASKGKNPGAHDLMIAATAIAIGGRVLTRDHRSFPLMPGLSFTLL